MALVNVFGSMASESTQIQARDYAASTLEHVTQIEKNGLTDAQLRAASVLVGLDAASLAALESTTVTVSNPTTGFATETSLAAVLGVLQGVLNISGEVSLDAATLAALESTTVTVSNQLSDVASESTLASLLVELQTQQKDALTDSELRAAPISVSGSVAVTNQITGFAQQTTLAALLAELQTQQKDALTDAELRSAPLAVTASALDIRNLVFATDKVDVSGSAVSVTGAVDASGSAVEITNFPVTQSISGSVSVTNFPATQTITGSVALDAPTLSALETTNAVTVNSSITPKSATATLAGTTLVHQPAAGKSIRLWWYNVGAKPDNTAHVLAGLRFTEVGADFFSTYLSQYGASASHSFKAGQSYYQGGVDEGLYVNLDVSQTVKVNIDFDEV